MSNAELIERLNKPCGRTTGHGESCSVGWLCGACADKAKAADALELADKRIAELEAKIDEAYKKGYATGEEEAERKLAIARQALSECVGYFESWGMHYGHDPASIALVQISTEEK